VLNIEESNLVDSNESLRLDIDEKWDFRHILDETCDTNLDSDGQWVALLVDHPMRISEWTLFEARLCEESFHFRIE